MSRADEAAGDEIRSAAKLREPDRYLAALLAPREVRDDLIAVAALSADLKRIADLVSEPARGEIRIQFYRDAYDGAAKGQRSGHPIADAAGDALRARDVPRNLVDDLLDAHAHRLYADAPPDDAALMLELEMTEGALFRIAARVLGLEMDGATETAITQAATAYGLARIGLDLPLSLARGRNPLPPNWSAAPGATGRDWKVAVQRLATESRAALQACRAGLHGCPAPLTTALLPLAVVEPYLKALQRQDHDPVHDAAEVAPLTRVWLIGQAHLLARI